MGALIGDALGVGPHWYYDLAEMKPNRYHAGLKAGQPYSERLEILDHCPSFIFGEVIAKAVPGVAATRLSLSR